MKQRNTSSNRPFNPDESAPNFLGQLLKSDSLVPPFPQFPTVQELLDPSAQNPLILATRSTPPPSEVFLHDALLGGDVRALIQDAHKNPDAYSPEARELLTDIEVGRLDVKTLPRGSAELLSRAVLDYATFKPKKPIPPVRKQEPPKKKPALLKMEDELPDERTPPDDLPDAELRPYWWV